MLDVIKEVDTEGCLKELADKARESLQEVPVCIRCGVEGCPAILEIEDPVELDADGRLRGTIEYIDLTGCRRK